SWSAICRYGDRSLPRSRDPSCTPTPPVVQTRAILCARTQGRASELSGTPKHSVSVAGVVVRADGRILAVQRRDNAHWEPPGGVLELDETFEAGVRREVAEETGITVEVERLTGAYKNLPRGIVALVFRCRPIAGHASTTTESRHVQWLTS